MKPKHNNRNKSFFNTWEFNQAYHTYHDLNNPIEAKILFEEYLKKYSKDYLAYSYYISVLINLGEFEQAENYLNNLKFLFKNKKIFSLDTDKLDALERRIVANTLRILAYQEKFEELYQYYLINQDVIKNKDSDMELNHVIFYCQKKLGMLNENQRRPNSYLFRQITKYDYNDFLEHIQKHLADFNQYADISNASIFAPDFPLNKVLEEIKKIIPSEKRQYTGFFEDSYVFKYDECGKSNNKLTNYFQIVSFHDTNDFITICPCNLYGELPYIDLNYLKQEDTKKFVRKLSQVEKFNQRYRKQK